MWTLIGFLLLSISTVSSEFVLPNSKQNLTVTTQNPTYEWRENNVVIFTLSYDSTADACNFHPPKTGFDSYCLDNGSTFVLEILNTSDHEGSVFTGNIEICTIEYPTQSNISAYPGVLNKEEDVRIEVVFLEAKSKPNISVIITIGLQNVMNYSIEDETVCDGGPTTYNMSFFVTVAKMKQLFGDQIFIGEKDIGIKVNPFYDGIDERFFGPVTPTVTIHLNPGGPHECYCYCLILVIIKAVLVVVAIILVIVHFCRKEAKAEGNVYWVLNVGFIIDGPVCFVLSIIQILYQIKAIACSRCMDRSGYDAAIALDVCGIIAAIVCIVCFVIRLKQRGKKTLNKPTEMKKTDPENKVGETRPLPLPNSS